MRILILLIIIFNISAAAFAEDFSLGDIVYPVSVKGNKYDIAEGILDDERTVAASGIEFTLKKGSEIKINTRGKYIESAILAKDAEVVSGENKLYAKADTRVFFYYRKHYKTKKITHVLKGMNFIKNQKIKIFGKELLCKAGVSEHFADISFDSKLIPVSFTLAEDFKIKINGTDYTFRADSKLDLFESVNKTENFIRSGNIRNPVTVKVGENQITIGATDPAKLPISDVTFNRKGEIAVARVTGSSDLKIGDIMYKYQSKSTIFFNDDGTVKCADWLIPGDYKIENQTIVCEAENGFCFDKNGKVISLGTHNSYDPWTLTYFNQKITIRGGSHIKLYDGEKIKSITPDKRGAEIMISGKKTEVPGNKTIFFDLEGNFIEVK